MKSSEQQEATFREKLAARCRSGAAQPRQAASPAEDTEEAAYAMPMARLRELADAQLSGKINRRA